MVFTFLQYTKIYLYLLGLDFLICLFINVVVVFVIVLAAAVVVYFAVQLGNPAIGSFMDTFQT